jgi:uncharacterized protein (DUF488 family)
MKLFTIGYTKKTAKIFFNLLKYNGIKVLLDIRRNNTSQLAAFTKEIDLKFFLEDLFNIKYIHDIKLAPSAELLKQYKLGNIDWTGYEDIFFREIKQNNIESHIKNNYINIDNICLLCSEEKPDRCHRRLVARVFSEIDKHVEIIHL